MSDILKINIFGEFSMEYGGATINDRINRSKKSWTLLAYLIIFRKRDIPQDEIIELLWPDNEIADPANALKTILHRTRNILGKLCMPNSNNLIMVSNGSYGWNPSIPCSVDADNFEAFCDDAYTSDCTDDERIELFVKALELIRGQVFAKETSDLWIVPVSTYYLSKYATAVVTTCKLMLKKNHFEQMARLCEKAILLNPFEEQFHYYYILAISKIGKHSQVVMHYNYVRKLFYEKFSIQLSDELEKLYMEISNTTNGVHLNLNTVKEKFHEKNTPKGCFYCDFNSFKHIYQFMSRSGIRTGEVAFICLFTVRNENKEVDSKPLEKIMTALNEAIKTSLRISDIYTKCSINQFLVIISSTNYETATVAVKRILKIFELKKSQHPGTIQYKLQPISTRTNNGG